MTSHIRTQDPYVDKVFLMQRIIGFDDELLAKRGGEPLQKTFVRPAKLPSTWSIVQTKQQKCWVCDRHIYSLLFWNKEIGELRNLKAVNYKIILENLVPLPYETKRPVLYC